MWWESYAWWHSSGEMWDTAAECNEMAVDSVAAALEDGLPYVVSLSVNNSCRFVAEGYSRVIPALQHFPRIAIFAEAHSILQDFFEGEDLTQKVCLHHDARGTEYPEVYEAWKATGHEENAITIAVCQDVGTWAVGVGGHKKGAQAAKLAMALTLATVATPSKIRKVVDGCPAFGKLLAKAGVSDKWA